MQWEQQFKNAEKVKKISKVIESEKKLRKEYDELTAKCEKAGPIPPPLVGLIAGR